MAVSDILNIKCHSVATTNWQLALYFMIVNVHKSELQQSL